MTPAPKYGGPSLPIGRVWLAELLCWAVIGGVLWAVRP